MYCLQLRKRKAGGECVSVRESRRHVSEFERARESGNPRLHIPDSLTLSNSHTGTDSHTRTVTT